MGLFGLILLVACWVGTIVGSAMTWCVSPAYWRRSNIRRNVLHVTAIYDVPNGGDTRSETQYWSLCFVYAAIFATLHFLAGKFDENGA